MSQSEKGDNAIGLDLHLVLYSTYKCHFRVPNGARRP